MSFFLTLLLLATVPAPPPASEAESAVVARVNGEDLDAFELERYLRNVHQAVGTAGRGAFDLDRLLFRMVNDTLLAQEARSLGLDEEPPVPEQVRRYRESLAVAALERERVTEEAAATPEEIRQTFESQYRRLTLQVVTFDEREAAEAAIEELRSGADMEAMAKERSVDPYAQRGGHVRSVARIDLQPEISELAASIEPGELGGPIRTDLGWSVLRLVERLPADPARFASRRGTVSQLVRHRKAQALRAAVAAEARRRHAVEIDAAVVSTLRAERLQDGRLVPRFDAADDAVVARLDAARPVTVGEYSKTLLARWSSVRSGEAALAAAPILLEGLLEKHLFAAAAADGGYAERPEVERAVRAYEKDLLVPRYLEQVVAPAVEVTREDLLRRFEERRESYRKPARLRIGQITVMTLEEAELVARLLREGTDLAWLAERRSIDRFQGQGGDRGWIEAGAGLDERLADAEAGDVLDPVGVPGNYVVFKVTAREEQGFLSFEEAAGRLRGEVLSTKIRQAIAELVDTLRSRSEIEVYEEVVATLRISGTKSVEEASGHVH